MSTLFVVTALAPLTFFNKVPQRLLETGLASVAVDVSLLINLGFMIGYVFCIMFVVVVQGEHFRTFKTEKPKICRNMMWVYHIMALGFLIYVFFDFNIIIALVLLGAFLLLSAGLNHLREKISDEDEASFIRPRRIL